MAREEREKANQERAPSRAGGGGSRAGVDSSTTRQRRLLWLLHSKSNQIRRASYRTPITKEECKSDKVKDDEGQEN
ncbi:hypothetical protein EJB05_31287, partial [Eragrostis curvula]